MKNTISNYGPGSRPKGVTPTWALGFPKGEVPSKKFLQSKIAELYEVDTPEAKHEVEYAVSILRDRYPACG